MKKSNIFVIIPVILAACLFVPARPAAADSWTGPDKGAHLLVGGGLSYASAEVLYSFHRKGLLRKKNSAMQPAWAAGKSGKKSLELTDREESGLKIQSILESTAFIFGISIVKELVDRSQGKEFSWQDITYAMGGNLIVSIPFYTFK